MVHCFLCLPACTVRTSRPRTFGRPEAYEKHGIIKFQAEIPENWINRKKFCCCFFIISCLTRRMVVESFARWLQAASLDWICVCTICVVCHMV